MIIKEKTYKFLAIAEGWEPAKFSIPPEQLSELTEIKALRSDTAEKIARQRMQELERKTGVKWTLHREPPNLSKRELRKKERANAPYKPTRFDKITKLVRLIEKIDGEIMNAASFRKGLWNKWHDIKVSPEYGKERLLYARAIIGLRFLVSEVGYSEDVNHLMELLIKRTPLYLNRFSDSDYDTSVIAINWFKTPQSVLKDEIPWMLMQTDYGRRRVRKAMIAEFGITDTEQENQ